MIGKVTRGSDVGGLLRYLYGPGKVNEHRQAHLVASWLGEDRSTLAGLEPAPAPAPRRFGPLSDRLSLPLQLLPDVPDRHVWQCSMRLSDTDPPLSEAEWADVADEVMHQTGFTPRGDEGGCRWVAVRHAEDHIHIVVVLARQDGQRVNTFRDWPKVHAAARAIEQRYGLTTVPSPNRSKTVAPTRAETEKATRTGRGEPARAYLIREVRYAAAASSSREEFERLLRRRPDVVIGWRLSARNDGQVTGYRVARRGDLDATAQQIWFSGSKLSPDLSLPKLQARWADTGCPRPMPRRQAWAHADRALRGIDPNSLDPATAIRAAEIATVVARLRESSRGGDLTTLAGDLADATRQPRGRRAVSGVSLRSLAIQLGRLGTARPSEAEQVADIAAHVIRIAHAVNMGQPSIVARRAWTSSAQPHRNDRALATSPRQHRTGQ